MSRLNEGQPYQAKPLVCPLLLTTHTSMTIYLEGIDDCPCSFGKYNHLLCSCVKLAPMWGADWRLALQTQVLAVYFGLL